MDIRDILIDGIAQMNEWMDGALDGLTTEQVNFLPQGKTVSIGFNAWHVFRTQDNITNFVLRKQPPLWMAQNYLERFGLPKVEQGTGMDLEIARGIQINDLGLLREYGQVVGKDSVAYLKDVDLGSLNEIQMVKPLGEMPRWRVFRQVCMTHGFMHLGEVNGIKGQLGLGFFL
ncbi:MAG: DinB family protein [Solimonas sp.]